MPELLKVAPHSAPRREAQGLGYRAKGYRYKVDKDIGIKHRCINVDMDVGAAFVVPGMSDVVGP